MSKVGTMVLSIISVDSTNNKENSGSWCLDEEGLALGIDVYPGSRVAFAPVILPKTAKSIQVKMPYLNPKKLPSKFNIKYRGSSGILRSVKSLIYNAKSFTATLDIDPSTLHLGSPTSITLFVDTPGGCLFLSGCWIEYTED